MILSDHASLCPFDMLRPRNLAAAGIVVFLTGTTAHAQTDEIQV